MKKFLSIVLVGILILGLTSCKSEDEKKNSKKKSDDFISCSICGEDNSVDNNFCTACGCGLSPLNGGGNSFDQNEHTVQSYTVLDYFKNTGDKPLILYSCEIAKDEEIGSVYVIKNRQCRLYNTSATLGEVSKMTDDEIIEMLEADYKEGLEEALTIWREDDFTRKAIYDGKVKLYQPRYYDITGCLFTDDTGNSVVGEMLFLPKAGIGGSPYVIKYPQHTDKGENYFMNYFGTSKDSDSPWDIKFNVKYFNTGYGTKSDLNQINQLLYLNENSITYGTVYNSHYCGIRETSNEWTEYESAFCFRISDPDNFQLNLDSLSSKEISVIDPSENDLLAISRTYYNTYYNSFGEFTTNEEKESGENFVSGGDFFAEG